jgi:hypothetical protein
MKLLQIVPRDGTRLYGAMVRKEADIRKTGRGTFSRASASGRKASRWKHAKYKGSVRLEAAASDVVSVEIKSPEKGDESRLLSAFLGWLDRHFGDAVQSVSIQYHGRPTGRKSARR